MIIICHKFGIASNIGVKLEKKLLLPGPLICKITCTEGLETKHLFSVAFHDFT